VTRKFCGALPSVVVWAGVRGQSIASMPGVGLLMLRNSAFSSVNMEPRNVFIAGPAGVHAWGGGVTMTACPRLMVGNRMPADVAAGRLAKEITTANVSTSFIRDVFIVFSKGCSEAVALKDYPRGGSMVNLKHDVDISGILEDS
jgi:hypothetical protein